MMHTIKSLLAETPGTMSLLLRVVFSPSRRLVQILGTRRRGKGCGKGASPEWAMTWEERGVLDGRLGRTYARYAMPAYARACEV